MADLTITAVKTFVVQPGGSRLVIVKLLTSRPGLYGLGCATFTQRAAAVQAAVDNHIGPFVTGKDPRAITDLCSSAMFGGYWRNGPVLNSAVGGVDMALWDIKGKLAGLPCYELWGGKCRPAAAVYGHADGKSPEQVLDSARGVIERGYHYVRCQLGCYTGVEAGQAPRPEGVQDGCCCDPREKLRRIPALFDLLRAELGDRIELLHDVHERMAPTDAVHLARLLEPYRLFFLEDLLAPEDAAYLANVRSVCATPIAMGELFTNPAEITPLVAGRLIDFVRAHISALGGIAPALKLAHLCEAFGVRIAWHGPGDVSPVGMAANVHLDVACRNFGVQEWARRSQAEVDMFPGMPTVRDGYAYPNDSPGLGVEFDEALAAKFPPDDADPTWTVVRAPDGTIWPP